MRRQHGWAGDAVTKGAWPPSRKNGESFWNGASQVTIGAGLLTIEVSVPAGRLHAQAPIRTG